MCSFLCRGERFEKTDARQINSIKIGVNNRVNPWAWQWQILSDNQHADVVVYLYIKKKKRCKFEIFADGRA